MMELYKYVALGNDFLITEFQESIDYKKYAELISKLFIVDFYIFQILQGIRYFQYNAIYYPCINIV